MSVASRIQEIETHIGDIYNTLEVGGADLTDLNKNIVNINSSLKDRYKYFLNNGVEVIWNNWEKVIGEGTEFTLENTIQAPMKVNLKGNTYQKTTTGKQLYDKDNASLRNAYLTFTGGYISADDWLMIEDYIEIKSSTNYIVSFQNIGARFIWCEYDDNKHIVGGRHENTTGSMQTTTGKYIRFCTNNPNATILQVEEGTTATTPEEYTGGIASPNPEFPQDIHVVSGDNTIEIVGKNLFDKDNAKHYSTDGSGNTTTTNYFNSTDYIPCNANESFTISGIPKTQSDFNFKVIFFDSNKNYISRPIAQFGTIGIRSNFSTTAPSNAKYVMAQFQNNIEEAQFEKGTSTTYEPYQKESYPINLGKNLLYNQKLPINQVSVNMTYNNGIFGVNGTASISSNAYIIDYSTPLTHLEAGESLTYYIERVSGTSKVAFLTYFIPDDGSTPDYTWGVTLVANTNSNKVVKTATKSGKVDHVQFFLTKDDIYDSEVKILVQKGNITNPTWAEYITPIELCKIGDYQDYFYKDNGKWYLRKAVRHLSLAIADMDNSETYPGWKNVSDLLNDYPDKNTLLSNFTDYMCNITNNDNVVSANTVFLAGGDTLFFNTGAIALTQTQWKTNYPNLVVELYYGLQTPYDEEKTDTTLLSQLEAIYKAISHDDQTNISQVNNDMPFKLEVTALKNI